jgi:hypothetical protein
MIKKINIILFFLMASFALNAQQIVTEGKVSYSSPELVYVNFENTDGISTGDTLFHKIKNTMYPALKVKYLSKNSLSGEKLTDKNIEVGAPIFAFVFIKDSSAINEIPPKILTEEVYPITVDPVTSTSNAFVKKEVSLSKTDGRYSVQSYTDFSNADSRGDYQRWRHSLRFNSQRIGESGFSFSAYTIFAYKTDEWDLIADNFGRALKIYDLNLKYEFDKTSRIWAGRFLNSKISNISTIDGLMVEKTFSSFTFGLIAGSRPNFTDFGFNSKLFEFGGYASKTDSLGSGVMENTISAFNQTNDFKTDRRFLYFQHTNNIINNTFLFASAEVDLFKKVNNTAQSDFSITGLFFSARFSPVREFSLNISYDARKNVIYYETFKSLSQTILENETRQGFRARANFKPLNNLNFSLQYGYRYRKGDLKPNTNYGANLGYSMLSIMESSANITFNRIISSYVDGYIYSASLSKSIYALRTDLSFGFRKTIYNFTSGIDKLEENAVLVDLSLNLVKALSISISYEGVFESTNTTGRILLDLTTRF